MKPTKKGGEEVNRRKFLGAAVAVAVTAASLVPFDLQATIDALPPGARYKVPPGTYKLRGPLTFRNLTDVHVDGAGVTAIIPADAKCYYDIRDCRDSLASNFTIQMAA